MHSQQEHSHLPQVMAQKPEPSRAGHLPHAFCSRQEKSPGGGVSTHGAVPWSVSTLPRLSMEATCDGEGQARAVGEGNFPLKMGD